MHLALEIAGGIAIVILILVFFRVLLVLANFVLTLLQQNPLIQWVLVVVGALVLVWWVWGRSWL